MGSLQAYTLRLSLSPGQNVWMPPEHNILAKSISKPWVLTVFIGSGYGVKYIAETTAKKVIPVLTCNPSWQELNLSLKLQGLTLYQVGLNSSRQNGIIDMGSSSPMSSCPTSATAGQLWNQPDTPTFPTTPSWSKMQALMKIFLQYTKGPDAQLIP